MRLTDANLVFVLHALIIIGVIYSVLVSTCFKLFFQFPIVIFTRSQRSQSQLHFHYRPLKAIDIFFSKHTMVFPLKNKKTKHRDYHALPDIKIRETFCRTDICTLISAAFCAKTLNFSKIYKVKRIKKQREMSEFNKT